MRNKKLSELSLAKTKEWSVKINGVNGQWHVAIHVTDKGTILKGGKVFLCPIFIELDNKKITDNTNNPEKSYPNKGIAEVMRKRVESFVVENERFPQNGDTI